MASDPIALMHKLRDAVVADTGDTFAVVRLECGLSTEAHLLMLVILYRDVYQPFLVEDDDFLDDDKLIAYCLNFMHKHPRPAAPGDA